MAHLIVAYNGITMIYYINTNYNDSYGDNMRYDVRASSPQVVVIALRRSWNPSRSDRDIIMFYFDLLTIGTQALKRCRFECCLFSGESNVFFFFGGGVSEAS